MMRARVIAAAIWSGGWGLIAAAPVASPTGAAGCALLAGAVAAFLTDPDGGG